MSDTFRKDYKQLSEGASAYIRQIKEACEAVEALMVAISSREMSLALTNLQQASMWGTLACVLHDEQVQQKLSEAAQPAEVAPEAVAQEEVPA